MTDITIPPEALEKAAKAIRDTFCNEMGLHNEPAWENSAEGLKEGYREEARAACLAMINNWPGMSQHGEDVLGPACIILPLTQDDER